VRAFFVSGVRMALRHNYSATGTNDAGKQVSVDRWNEAHAIDQNGLDFPAATTIPAAPATDVLRIFARKIAGRMLAAFMGPTGLDQTLQPHIGRNNVASWRPHGGTALSGLGCTLTATGTATAPTMATTNLHQSMSRLDFLVTVAAATAVAGYRGQGQRFHRGNAAGRGGFYHVHRAGPATGVTVATRRCFFGLRGANAAPTDVQPSTLLDILGVGYDAADANWFVMHNDGTGAATKVDTGIARPSADRTSVVELSLYTPPNGSSVFVTVTDLVGGTVFNATLTTDLPANTVFLNEFGFASVGGTSSVVGLALFGCYTDSDN
jgi:hypothetical protein